MIMCLPQTACTGGDKEPTAIVIDAETGKPVESAVALAQWFRAAGGSVAEGGSEALDKAAEAFSDKEGKIYIDGFWGMNIFTRDPRLTVYKPGYVIWDSRKICPNDQEKRTDFDKAHRTVKLLKFETEAPKWVEKYPNEAGPRSMQKLFYNSCYDSGIVRKYSRSEIKIDNIFYNYELPLIEKEKFERSQKSKFK
jgi:hypothetical protein